MAFSKIRLNGTTLMDVTGDTVDASNLLYGETATKNDGTTVTGSYSPVTVSSLSVTDNGTYTAPSGTAYSPVTVNVSGGGGGGGSTDGDVIFIDYDGSIVASKTKAEIDLMSSDSDLPANPSHTGLTAQGWNWTVAQIKSQLTNVPGGKVIVGQSYITTSGATEIDFTLDDSDYLSPYLCFGVKGTATIDWGDNSSTDTVTGTNVGTIQYTQHVYATTGNYTIKISVSSGDSYRFLAQGSVYASVFRTNTSANDTYSGYNYYYQSGITAIRLGESVNLGGSYSFVHCSSMRYITIPNYITSFGSNSFQRCCQLKAIIFPSGTTTIPGSACYYCYSLELASIPSTVTNFDSNIFYYCENLKYATINYGITSLPSNFFASCFGLREIKIPSTVTSIQSNCFSYCYNLKELNYPSGLTTLGNYALQGLSGIKSITIPSNITTLKASFFSGCYSLSSIKFSSAITSMSGTSIFNNCNSLRFKFTIPNGTTAIENSTFYNCYNLTSVTIPSGVTSIGNTAFYQCFSLTNITIPSTVATINGQAFSSCYNLREYHFLPTSPPTLVNTNAFAYIHSATVIYVPRSENQTVLNAYKTAQNWSTYASYIQEEPQS